jgi:hypothetical protein
MESLREFLIALGGVGIGIAGYAVSKIMGFGSFKKKPLETLAGIGLIGGSIVTFKYGDRVIKNRDVILFGSTMIGTSGLLKLFDTYSSEIASGIAKLTSFKFSRSSTTSSSAQSRSSTTPSPAQKTVPVEELTERTPGLMF